MNSVITTVMGILAALTAIGGALVLLADGDPATNPNWDVVAAAVIAGVGLIAARDNGKTSEAAGANTRAR